MTLFNGSVCLVLTCVSDTHLTLFRKELCWNVVILPLFFLNFDPERIVKMLNTKFSGQTQAKHYNP